MTNEGLHYDYDKAEDKSFRVVDSGTGKRKGACARAWALGGVLMMLKMLGARAGTSTID